MCGIAGTINSAPPRRVLDRLAHRGPDGQGEQYLHIGGKPVWFGHTRLAILDPSPAGHQPMQSRDGRWWLTFNGEIYNHLELRKFLYGQFRGHSDTETLLELIAARGMNKVLSLLNGMFAFAALDTLENKLYLVRDPFGVKPLYYIQTGDVFAFSSEVRLLKAITVEAGAVDADALQLFLTLRYTPAPSTLLFNVRRLEPGHVLAIDINTSQITTSPYIQPVRERFVGTIEDAVGAYQQMLHKAVLRQLISDMPVGMLLSGGIDSALVAAMAKDSGYNLPCFTVGFGESHSECEIHEAADTARTLGLPFEAIELTPDMLRNALPDIVSAVEEPLGTTSIMPMWYLVQKARKDVTVVLTGQGSDEPWGGYRRYQVEMLRGLLPWSSLWRMVRWLGNYAHDLPDAVVRGMRVLPIKDMVDRAVEACALFTSEERQQLVGREDDGGARRSTQRWIDWLRDDCSCEPAEIMMRVDVRMNLADDLLLYGDKIAMAFALEARVPMLDIELVRFVESLPLHYRIALQRTKIVHKRMAERYLPASIVHRKKKGFAVPFDVWSRSVWRDFIEDILLAPNAKHFGLLDNKFVRQIWEEHLAGRPVRSRQIFALLALALWWRQL